MKQEKNNLIKSRQRVREHGEVFTPEHIVKDMVDLIPADVQENLTSTWLEPTCGNGNFLVEIYARKLKLCKDERDGLKGLACIFGIDILEDNVQESRARLLEMYKQAFPNASEFAKACAESILNCNIICGDSLKIMKEWEERNTKYEN